MIHHGDCLTVMRGMEPDSVDAIVTDPPYGLAFMGKEWDKGVPGEPFWREAYRVAKPGTWLLAMGGTRTFHRLACAIEDAGWTYRDTLSWLYGQGFPKGKACLKPGWEPVLLARKGTANLRIDETRIGVGSDKTPAPLRRVNSRPAFTGLAHLGGNDSLGRWPANVCLDEEAAAMLDEQTGMLPAGVAVRRNGKGGKFFGGINPKFTPDVPFPDAGFPDSGGASRFFYVAKASRSEREAGLAGEQREAPKQGGAPIGRVSSIEKRGGDIRLRNHHPTVKPIALMRWLCRLVTPPGGTVLDPFAGSGTTGCAAALEGFQFIGIEQEAEYVEIARQRIAHHSREPGLPLEATLA